MCYLNFVETTYVNKSVHRACGILSLSVLRVQVACLTLLKLSHTHKHTPKVTTQFNDPHFRFACIICAFAELDRRTDATGLLFEPDERLLDDVSAEIAHQTLSAGGQDRQDTGEKVSVDPKPNPTYTYSYICASDPSAHPSFAAHSIDNQLSRVRVRLFVSQV